jgi:hypothetical protein
VALKRFSTMQAQSSFPWVARLSQPLQGAPDFSFLIDHTPAGAKGWVRVGADGHYYLSNRRIRFWGVNITAGACFPEPDAAPRMATQIAQAGCNIVRFHHMDAFWASPSLIDYARGNSRQFNTQALARFDELFAQLRTRGIYANLNLLVNRRFSAADGLPAEIDQIGEVKAQHAIGCYYRPLIDLQKEFARQLLTHRNPKTGRTYAEDPAVAMVEINNENGLIQGWLMGYIDGAPKVFQDDLQRQWNEWLQRKYADTDAVRRAWDIILHSQRSATPTPLLRDWLQFLWDTERAYWLEMATYIKRDLGYRGIVFGTIVGCSTPHLMAQLDTVDGHAYWMHPEFPGAAWDFNNWFVRNAPMVNSDDTTLRRLAQHRVWGKPYTVTEYDHPAPNQYAAEGLPLLAAHGALQDWDGLFAFDYGGSDGEGRIGAFFEQRTHPAKWALMRACAALFLRADVRPAQRLVCAPFPREAEMDALRQVWAWGLPDGRFAGLDGKAATMHRLATALEPAQVPRDALRPDAITIPDRRRVSDTGELIWDRTQAGRGYFVVRAKRSKMAVGFIGGRTLDLGDKFSLQVQDAPLGGFGVVAITVLQEKPVWRALITTVSAAENTGWNLRDLGEGRITLGNQWGDAPTRVAAPTATLTLPYPAARVRVWALDEDGKRARALKPSPVGNDRAAIELSPQHRTLWYEVEARG